MLLVCLGAPRSSGASVSTWSQREALRSGRGKVETEHVLLGLLGLRDGIAAEVFAELGITINIAEKRIEALDAMGIDP